MPYTGVKDRVCECGRPFTGAHRKCGRCRVRKRTCACGHVYTGTHLRCHRCRVPEQVCECGRVYSDAHRRCPACRAEGKICACGTTFNSTHTRCPRCTAIERTCECGYTYTGSALRCHRCLAITRDCDACGQSFTGTKRKCWSCIGTERPCDTCGLPFIGHERRCRACSRKLLPPDERAAKDLRIRNARRARRVAAEVTGPVPAAVYAAIRSSGPCVYCGEPATTVDHVQPLSRGGWEHASNLVPACGFCNFSKRAKLLTEWRPDRVARAVECSAAVAAVWERLTGEMAV